MTFNTTCVGNFQTNDFVSVALIVGFSIVTLATVCFNALYITVSLKYRNEKLEISEVLFLLLSVSDLITGLFCTSLSVAFWWRVINATFHCSLLLLNYALGHSFASMSITTITMITIEIYLSVNRPFLHQRFITMKRMVTSNVLLWLVSILAPMLSWGVSTRSLHDFQDFSGTTVVLILIILFVLHLQIFFEINKMSRKIKANDKNGVRMIQAKRRTFIMSFLMLGTVASCFLPVIVYSIYVTINGRSTLGVSFALPAVHFAALLNPMLDPFVYYFRLSKVRRNIRRLFGKSGPRSNENKNRNNQFDPTMLRFSQTRAGV